MRSLALLWLSAGFAAVVAAAPASCGGPAFEVVPDASTSGGTPDASLDRTPGDTGVEGAPPDASPPPEGGVDAATGGIIYVSPTGNDVRTGLLRTQPKRTIGSALVEAATHPGAFTVEVCAGMYSEARLTISADVILLGGYDCKAWTRTQTYGYPAFDGKNATTITNAEPTSAGYTLQVNGNVTSATVIDGFAIAGGATTGVSSGLVVAAGTPLVRNDEIAGGSGQGGTTSIGSHGIIVDGTAAPEITACIIDGGSGTGSQGSIGVYLGTTGAVNLHDALIIGGTGTSTVSNSESAVGVEVRSSLADAQPLKGLIVSATDKAGAPGSVAGIYVASLGAAAAPVSAAILGCYVSGGTSTNAHGISAGILVSDPGGTVTLAADHIYGGAAPATPSAAYGILVRAAGALTVADSIIHAGTVSNGAGDAATGVDVTAVAAPSIVFDTIYTGAASGAAVALNAGVSNAVVTDDLLLGSDASLGTYGVTASQCSALLKTLDHTAFVNLTDLYRCSPGDGGAFIAAPDYPTLLLELGKSATTGDVVLQSTCTLAAGCAPVSGCPQTGTGCLTAVFGSSWSTTDDGVCSLFGLCPADAGVPADGWTLAPGSPCAVTAGGVPIANLTTDAYGQTRSATAPTMGAAEYAQSASCK